MDSSVERTPRSRSNTSSSFPAQFLPSKGADRFSKKSELRKAACQALGYDLNDLTVKSRDELYDPKKTKEANELRYRHHLKRHQYKMSQIEIKMQELTSETAILPAKQFILEQDMGDLKQKAESKFGQVVQKSSYENSHRNQMNGSRVRNYVHSQDGSESDNSLGDNIESESNQAALQVISTYKEKLNKIQEQWAEETRNMKNKPNNDTSKALNQVLRDQVQKMNRGLEKAEKYAQSVVDIHKKRQVLRKEKIERDNKTKAILKKQELKRNESLKEKNKLFEEKMQSLKEQKREYNRKLRDKAKKLAERFKELEGFLERKKDDRNRSMVSQSMIFTERIDKIKEQKEAEYEELVQTVRKEEDRAEKTLDALRKGIQLKCSESAKLFEQNLERAKEKRKFLENQMKTNTIAKLCQKSIGTENIKEGIKKVLVSKKKEIQEKEEKHKENYKEVLKSQRKWVKDVVQLYKKSEEHLKEFEGEKLKQSVLKRETNSLRREDHEQNMSGLHRIQEMKNLKILEKEKADSLKIALLKQQSKILSQARIDVDRMMKQKIDNMIDQAFKEERRLERTRNKSVPNTRVLLQ